MTDFFMKYLKFVYSDVLTKMTRNDSDAEKPAIFKSSYTREYLDPFLLEIY